jgi:hypothetical protein
MWPISNGRTDKKCILYVGTIALYAMTVFLPGNKPQLVKVIKQGLIIKYALVFSTLLLLLFLPEKYLAGSGSVCVFKNLTGYECPLCGMTRAAYYFIRFQPLLSLSYNPLVVFLPIWLVVEIIHDLYPLKKWISTGRKWLWWGIGLGFSVLFIVRLL